LRFLPEDLLSGLGGICGFPDSFQADTLIQF
jgi:hypothetical protein